MQGEIQVWLPILAIIVMLVVNLIKRSDKPVDMLETRVAVLETIARDNHGNIASILATISALQASNAAHLASDAASNLMISKQLERIEDKLDEHLRVAR
jgi:hypothetical protein